MNEVSRVEQVTLQVQDRQVGALVDNSEDVSSLLVVSIFDIFEGQDLDLVE